MKLWFYKASKGNITDKTIAWWTKGPYSHVELVFSDGECFTSSNRDGGVRFKVIPPSDNWDVVTLPMDFNEAEVKSYCNQFLGYKYDLLGCLGLAIGDPKLRDKKRWYCSEIVINVLNHFTDLKFPGQLSPNRFYDQTIYKMIGS